MFHPYLNCPWSRKLGFVIKKRNASKNQGTDRVSKDPLFSQCEVIEQERTPNETRKDVDIQNDT